MSYINTYKGFIQMEYDCDYHECLLIDGVNIHDVLDDIKNEIVTIKYYISDRESTEEQLMADFLINTLYGSLESEFYVSYSEITGYLWTNDELKIGGHDLRKELEYHNGKYLYMVAEVH